MNNRREFISGTGVVGFGWFAFALAGRSSQQESEEESEGPSKLAPELVSSFVGKSHGDLKSIKEMLGKEPALINATWDWGNGDWETGLGAASHVGRRDIAEYLLEHGARLDAFAATMLGVKPIVEQMLVAFPKIHAVPGPHGICLLSHAIFGRDKADPIFELLLDVGADVNSRTGQESTPLMAASSVGRANIVEVLLEKGADPRAVDSANKTALDRATKREHAEVVALLEAALRN